jgi:hypothetical protein
MKKSKQNFLKKLPDKSDNISFVEDYKTYKLKLSRNFVFELLSNHFDIRFILDDLELKIEDDFLIIKMKE